MRNICKRANSAFFIYAKVKGRDKMPGCKKLCFFSFLYDLLEYHTEGHTAAIPLRYLQKRIQNIHSIPQNLYTGGDYTALLPQDRTHVCVPPCQDSITEMTTYYQCHPTYEHEKRHKRILNIFSWITSRSDNCWWLKVKKVQRWKGTKLPQDINENMCANFGLQ